MRDIKDILYGKKYIYISSFLAIFQLGHMYLREAVNRLRVKDQTPSPLFGCTHLPGYSIFQAASVAMGQISDPSVADPTEAFTRNLLTASLNRCTKMCAWKDIFIFYALIRTNFSVSYEHFFLISPEEGPDIRVRIFHFDFHARKTLIPASHNK